MGITGTGGNDSVSVNGASATINGGAPVGYSSVGSIVLGGGDDSLIVTNASVQANVDLGNDSDTATLTSVSVGGAVLLGNASDRLIVSNSSINGVLDGGTGDDFVNLSTVSQLDAVSLGDGLDTLIASAITVSGGINAGAGIDVVTLSQSSVGGALLLGTGNDVLSLAQSTIAGAIDAGSGNDTVQIDTRNVIGGTVTGGSGADALILQGGGFSISLSAAATLTNSTTTTLVTEANYSLVAGFNGGAITGTVSLGASGDTFAVNSFESLDRIICFARGTMLRVAGGTETAVEALRIGDLVETMDAGSQPVRWVGMRRYSAAELGAVPHLRPIRIVAGALGRGLPDRDLIVSPHHRMLVVGKIVKRMFGVDEVLVAAKQLLDLPGIDRLGDETGVDYFHIMFDRHQVVFAHGAPSESFFVGREAVAALDSEARAEVLAIFPDLAGDAPMDCMAPVRLLVTGRRGRNLAGRCAAHGRGLL
ncbi:MAG: Hint domain-containing protein [Paracoccaceae bacterium]